MDSTSTARPGMPRFIPWLDDFDGYTIDDQPWAGIQDRREQMFAPFAAIRHNTYVGRMPMTYSAREAILDGCQMLNDETMPVDTLEWVSTRDESVTAADVAEAAGLIGEDAR